MRVYVTTIRPVAEYAANILHPMLTLEQSHLIERQQDLALKFIYGIKTSAGKCRKRSGLQTQAQRRFVACKNFAELALESERFRRWFSERPPPVHTQRVGVLYE